MQLIQDRAEGYFFIRACNPKSIIVIDRELHASFVISPDRVIENWPVNTVAALSVSAMESILALEPELVLFGSGERQQFPAQEMLLPLLRRGIGVEVMNNAAAARTYNLLAAEGRRVVASFIFGE